MLPQNKKLLTWLFGISFLLYFIIIFAVNITLKHYVLVENKKKLNDILLYEQALKMYIENHQKPVIYKLQNQKILPKSFFDPNILSSTYIARHTIEEYNILRKQDNLEPIIYKIASDNPRNIVNKANKFELELLEKFNKGELKHFSKKIEKNGEEYIYYALPFLPNQQSCMRCHSNPKFAPKDLLKRYGDKAGFYEKVGHIRAFFSITLSLKDDYQFIKEICFIFNISLFLIFLVSFIIIYYVVKKLDEKDKKLIDNSNRDGLTNIYNRKKFNQDINKIIENKRGEQLFLMIFDIDHFKTVNDTFGHPTGDSILKELTELITNNIRDYDKFYRIGGEEFAIISIQDSYKNNMKFTEKIRKIVEEFEFNKIGKVTISIGFSEYKKGESYLEWYQRVDKALYKAKENGRNQVIGI